MKNQLSKALVYGMSQWNSLSDAQIIAARVLLLAVAGYFFFPEYFLSTSMLSWLAIITLGMFATYKLGLISDLALAVTMFAAYTLLAVIMFAAYTLPPMFPDILGCCYGAMINSVFQYVIA